ncbi:Esterase E4 [Papilio machaon]|uniref:Carboxylic ester hydrolase n=1 Tax=Papilio machaon TaxID=76193 RepID=A0A194R4Z8_PAPMA|nr:Esterase E4 [Papilio machaon]
MATVSIEQGMLQGRKSQTDNRFVFYEFVGIPYAKPPVGQLRFKSPQPPEKWYGVRDATVANKNNVSLQTDVISGRVVGSEDCLYLNVYTPKIPAEKSETLPVMIYIHGGGFIRGNGILENEHGPDFLIEHNVVIVTINYRLSVLGFLSLDIPEVAGNMGLKDQVKALEWVQNNIKHFGGDKNNITLFGLSAGSACVEYHIVSPRSKGLFHKAILQSGSCLNHWAVNNESMKVVSLLAASLGYKGSLENKICLNEFFLNIPGTALTASATQIAENWKVDGFFFGFVPCIEKDFGNGEAFLTEKPYELLKMGNFNHVPVIKGFCNKEGYLMRIAKPKTISHILEMKIFTDRWSFDFDATERCKYDAQLAQAYSEDIKPGDEYDALAVDFITDSEMVSGIWISGKMMAGHGVPVRFYEFCYDGNINYFKRLCCIKGRGAAHTDDQSYVLCHKLMRRAIGQDLIIRNLMTKMWTNFAKYSSPTPEDRLETLTEWPAFTENNPVSLRIDREIKLLTNYEPKRMKIFEEIYDKHYSC